MPRFRKCLKNNFETYLISLHYHFLIFQNISLKRFFVYVVKLLFNVSVAIPLLNIYFSTDHAVDDINII